jgi:hypothetical protein
MRREKDGSCLWACRRVQILRTGAVVASNLDESRTGEANDAVISIPVPSLNQDFIRQTGGVGEAFQHGGISSGDTGRHA